MNILQKLDRIDPPYSTLLSLTVCILVWVSFRYFRPESGSLGVGIMVGAIIAIAFASALYAVSVHGLIVLHSGFLQTQPRGYAVGCKNLSEYKLFA